MKRTWNKKKTGLAAAALVLTLGVTAGKATAYFTTYVTASGGYELQLGFTATIPDEKVSDWTKDITITNTGENPCYVRVRAFAGDRYGLSCVTEATDSRWSALGNEKNPYYYWHEILEPGASTGPLLIKIDKKDAAEDFNVVIVQECTPVPYDENGNPETWENVNWSRTADVVKTETAWSTKGGEDEE